MKFYTAILAFCFTSMLFGSAKKEKRDITQIPWVIPKSRLRTQTYTDVLLLPDSVTFRACAGRKVFSKEMPSGVELLDIYQRSNIYGVEQKLRLKGLGHVPIGICLVTFDLTTRSITRLETASLDRHIKTTTFRSGPMTNCTFLMKFNSKENNGLKIYKGLVSGNVLKKCPKKAIALLIDLQKIEAFLNPSK